MIPTDSTVRLDAATSAKNQQIVTELLRNEPRFDAGVSIFTDVQLQAIEAQLYHVVYQDLKARQFLPLKTDVPSGAETFAYRVLDVFGRADFIANYANDLPNTSIRGEKKVGRVEGIGNSYSFSTQDLRAAAMAGVGLDSEMAIGAMRAHEERVNETALLGSTAYGFLGFFNHPDPAIIAATGNWGSLTGLQRLTDLNSLANKVQSQSNGKWLANTLILPLTSHLDVSATPVNTFSTETVLAAFLKNRSDIKNVLWDAHLETAGVGGVKRAVGYQMDPRVAQLCIPMEAIQGEPEKRCLTWTRPIESRFGGSVVRQPLAIAYMDGI